MSADAAIDRIFARLSIRYGDAWVRMWEGIDIALVKADWAQELAGTRGAAIRFALSNLPTDRPPNALQFREICRRAPAPPAPRLPAPPVDPEKAAEALNRAAEALAKPDKPSTLEKLAGMTEHGQPLTQFQRELMRDLQRRVEAHEPPQEI